MYTRKSIIAVAAVGSLALAVPTFAQAKDNPSNSKSNSSAVNSYKHTISTPVGSANSTPKGSRKH